MLLLEANMLTQPAKSPTKPGFKRVDAPREYHVTMTIEDFSETVIG